MSWLCTINLRLHTRKRSNMTVWSTPMRWFRPPLQVCPNIVQLIGLVDCRIRQRDHQGHSFFLSFTTFDKSCFKHCIQHSHLWNSYKLYTPFNRHWQVFTNISHLLLLTSQVLMILDLISFNENYTSHCIMYCIYSRQKFIHLYKSAVGESESIPP